jgi:KilA-N domain
MTTAAKQFGKQLQNFWNSPNTVEYVAALVDSLTLNSNDKPIKLTDITRGSGLHASTGTWAHPKLAVFFARWLNVRFAVWCDMQRPSIFPR